MKHNRNFAALLLLAMLAATACGGMEAAPVDSTDAGNSTETKAPETEIVN